MLHSADYWIEKLGLQVHPEGGWFAEFYRSAESIEKDCLPKRYKENHTFSTSIYFLLKSGDASHLHRLKTDEIWHFYAGCPLEMVNIDPDGRLEEIILGDDPDKGHQLQALKPAGRWFGARPLEQNSYSLVGCTVAPGFEFGDFELGNREELLEIYPQYKDIILRLTR
jgi:predicted cupin superfamily sugar epimerase